MTLTQQFSLMALLLVIAPVITAPAVQTTKSPDVFFAIRDNTELNHDRRSYGHTNDHDAPIQISIIESDTLPRASIVAPAAEEAFSDTASDDGYCADEDSDLAMLIDATGKLQLSDDELIDTTDPVAQAFQNAVASGNINAATAILTTINTTSPQAAAEIAEQLSGVFQDVYSMSAEDARIQLDLLFGKPIPELSAQDYQQAREDLIRNIFFNVP
ncbi:hypothetical protein M1466_02895 [Candidatus Dependentiae bacterium]|nr:hypothetical protein [Candidatus Dependentiae bacterium]